MKRYWDIANDLYPNKRDPLPESIWRALIRRTLSRFGHFVEEVGCTAERADVQLISRLLAPAGRMADRTSTFPTTVHCIGSLGAGGAERQLVNLLVGLSDRGHRAQTLLTINPLEGDAAHYAELLALEAIDVRSMNMPIREEGIELIRRNPDTVDLLKRLPAAFNAWSLDLWVELSMLKPDLAHFWLDHSNIWGAPAALLADVPAVILSTRNVHPENFPYLHTPYFKEWYHWLEKSIRVHFINNSRPGAQSYAEWLGVSLSRFEVVLNGVNLDHLRRAGDADRARLRREIGVPDNAVAIVGAFRLSEEKRPLLFVDLCARVMQRNESAHAVLMGEGPLRAEVEATAASLGIADRFHAIGRRSDVAEVMSSMDVFLHTAWWEGTPNVVLEAQQLALPVVVAAGGGAADAVADGRTGYLVPREDVDALAEALIAVIDNLEHWKERAAYGPEFIRQRFSVDRMIDETLAVQRRACGITNEAGALQEA